MSTLPNERADRARRQKVMKLLDVIGQLCVDAYGTDDAMPSAAFLRTLPAEHREVLATQAGVNSPSAETWNMVVTAMATREAIRESKWASRLESAMNGASFGELPMNPLGLVVVPAYVEPDDPFEGLPK